MNKKIRELLNKYTYRVEWSEEDDTHIARCLEFPGLSAHGKTIEDAIKEIAVAVEGSLEWLIEDGDKIPEPMGQAQYKGNLTLRVSPEIHKELAIKSAEQGISINQYILSKIS